MASPIKHRGKWRIRWVDETGARRSAVLTTFAEAKTELARCESLAEDVRRGVKLPLPPDKSFDDLATYWEQNRAPLKRSCKDDLCILRRYLRPAFNEVRLLALGVQHTDRLMAERLSHLEKKTASNILTLLISMLNLAVELGWLHRVPRIRKPRVRLFSKDYRWLRTDEEMGRLLNEARVEGEVTFMLYATALYTGMRAGELAALTWEDIDFGTRLIVVQRSFDGPTKGEDLRYVPILDPLLPLLREWRLKCGSGLLFPNSVGQMFGKSSRVFQEVLHRMLEAAAFPKIERAKKSHRYIVFHSLRHYAEPRIMPTPRVMVRLRLSRAAVWLS